MKKIVIMLGIVCLAFAMVICIPEIKGITNPGTSNVDITSVETPAVEKKTYVIDFDALYSLHDPNEIVAKVGGRDVEWQEYYYWLVYNIEQVESYISTMETNYGLKVDWNDEFYDGNTFLDYAVQLTDDSLRQANSLYTLYENSGADLSDELDEYLKEVFAADKATYCGENSSDEDFLAFLEEQHTTLDVYNRVNSMRFFLSHLKDVFYGENCELVTDEQAAQTLEDEGYIYYANHIFFKSENDDDAVLAKAQDLCDELRAIKDTDELLARFAQRKEELDEDSGKTVYSNGYIFKTDQMVPEFEQTAGVLKDYEISDPIKSQYGYHVMIGLPMNYDIPVNGGVGTARQIFASNDYNRLIEEIYNNLEVEHLNNSGKLNLDDFTK